MPAVGTLAYPTAGDAFSLVRSMLNDADIPSILTITAIGASRASNVASITTDAPHNLQIGDFVQVAFVTNSSFNGTQKVTGIPTPTRFTYDQAAADASSGNGTVSVLIQGDVYQDAVLLPFVNKAYRKVQFRLFENSAQQQKNETIIQLPAGTTDLLDATSPQLPSDFLSPITLEERITGQLYFSAPMKKVDILPSVAQSSVNGIYAWWEDGLHFVGATSDTDLRLRYTVSFPGASDASSVLSIRGCLDVVADWAAYLAANSRAATAGNAMTFFSMFEQDMKEFLNLQAHARQNQPSRRRPNNLGRRGLAGWGMG